MQPMRRESPYPMVPIDEAQRLIAAQVAPLGVEQIDIRGDDGRRVLAEDVFADAALPDVPKAAVDGYALSAEDGMAERRVLGELTAGGSSQVVLTAGTAARIMTGAPVPEGADAVIMVEQTDEREGVLSIRQLVKPGDSIHTVGQDIAQGELVLARGAALYSKPNPARL